MFESEVSFLKVLDLCSINPQGSLVSIHGLADNEKLTAQFHKDFYFGGIRDGKTWVWTSGPIFDNSNWAYG
ncbi:hypothetical protein L596_026183 [Steinernema carpocapsae]|uniref:C-type lectin domain-containing protein n=1 Tax=Steinernema carpocapsae TaxID=34508 RepID=A0A4U5M0L6_STECR|nr:hypothetical protein L596_026183 [Steinernema carpocapsae]